MRGAAENFPVSFERFEAGFREARRAGIDLEYGARTQAAVLRETGGPDSPLMPFLVEGEFGSVDWKNFAERATQIEAFFSALIPDIF